MPKACEIKRNAIVTLDGAPCILEDLHVQSPSARGGASLYKCRFRNLATKQKVDKTFKGDDMIEAAQFERRDVQYLYLQGESYVFMDLETYEQFELHQSVLNYERDYLVEDMEGILAMIYEENVIGIELPPAVELDIVECDPSIKGASATARTKPATLSTGLVIQVPEHISNGETVRVDTRDARFLGRA